LTTRLIDRLPKNDKRSTTREKNMRRSITDKHSVPHWRLAAALSRLLPAGLCACLAFAMLFATAPDARAQQAGVDEAARALLPETLRKSGVLHVGLEVNYAPWMYQEGADAIGIDPDLFRGITTKLGLKPDFAFVAFSSIIPAVQSGRFDVGANFANTPARREIVTFVNYMNFVGGLLVLKGNPLKIDVKNLCGVRISSGVGTVSHANNEKLSEQCVKNGKPPLTLVFLPPAEGATALRTNRVDAADVGMVANVYAASQPNGQDLEALEGAPPNLVAANKLGYITNKGTEGVALGKAMAAALTTMIKSGEYAAILKKWKIPNEAALPEGSSD
jgi:polar amino acid transport system substrate-binding protein